MENPTQQEIGMEIVRQLVELNLRLKDIANAIDEKVI